MKQKVNWLLILVVCLSLLVGCGQEAAPVPEPQEQPVEENVQEEEPIPEEEPVSEEEPTPEETPMQEEEYPVGVWYSSEADACAAILRQNQILLVGDQQLQQGSFEQDSDTLEAVVFGPHGSQDPLEEHITLQWKPQNDTLRKKNTTYERTHERDHYEMVIEGLLALEDRGAQNWQTQFDMNQGSGILAAMWASLEAEVYSYTIEALPPEEQVSLQEGTERLMQERETALEQLREEGGSMGLLNANLQACNDSLVRIRQLLDIRTGSLLRQEELANAPMVQYQKQLEQARNEVQWIDETGYENGYLLLEITGDDVPELFVKNNFSTTIYTCTDTGTMESVGEVDGKHSNICPLSEGQGFAVVMQRQGGEMIWTYTWENGALQGGEEVYNQIVEEFAENEIPRDELQGYHKFESGRYFTLDDESGLEQPLQPSNYNQMAVDILMKEA